MANHPPEIPYLVMHQGPRPQQAFSLRKNLLTLGRAEDNDIVIDDAEVSRHHARLTWQGNTWVIEDLGSSNGTYINGQRISAPTILAAGSQLQLGPDVVLGMQAGAMGAKRPARKRKFPLSVGLAGAIATVGILVLGVLAVLGYVYLSGNWPFGLAQGALPSGPTVIIQEPVPGTQVAKGDSFIVFVSSHDEDGVTRIDLWADDLLLLSQASPDEGGMTPMTLSYPLVAVETGSYALIARAYNSQGEMGESAVHYVTVYDMNASRQDLAQYIVQEGDTLESIAGKVGVPESTIGAVNPHLGGGQPKAGQPILVPAAPPPSRAVPPPPPPPVPPPARPAPANQPALKIKNLSVLTSPVFYGQACTTEPLTTNVVVTVDSAAAVKTATLNYAYYGKAGSSGVHALPMVSIGGSDFGATIHAGGEAEKFLAQDGGWADIWVDILDTNGQNSISKVSTITIIFCANIVPPGGQQPPGGQAGQGPGILPGLLPGAVGQAGQAGVFQPGQGPVAGIVANILPQWNPGIFLPDHKTAMPTGFKADLAADCEVALSWKDEADNEVYYEIYRYDPGSPDDKPIKKLPENAEAFTDKVPQPGKYGYNLAVAGKEGNQIRLILGQPVWLTVPPSQDCQPQPDFQRIFFRLLSFVPSDSSLTWGFIEATVRGLPTIRIPDASNVRTGNLANYSTFTRSMPAPESFYTDPDSLLFIEFQGNATADTKKNPPTALGQFASSHSYTDMTASDARTAVWKATDKGFTITYSIWMENWFWGSRSQANPKVPAPYNLKLGTSGADHHLTWDFDLGGFNPKYLDGFIIYRQYTCPGADVAMKYPLTVDKNSRNASINVVDAPLGCECAYSVSAYGSQGESPPSKPQQETCKTNDPIDSVEVTFEQLTIHAKNLQNNLPFNPTSASVHLFANEQTRRSGVQLLEAKTYLLKDMFFNGRNDNQSIIVNLGSGNSLAVHLSYYVSNICKGKDLIINKQGDSWLSVAGTYTIFSSDGSCEMLVSLKGIPTAASQSSSSASLSNDGAACYGSDECKSGICQAGLCAPAYLGVENAYCYYNSHCISGLCVCQDENGNEVTCPKNPQEGDGGKCSGGLPLASRCTSNNQCGSGYCANGLCAPEDGTGQIGDYCHHQNHCANDFCFCPDGFDGDFCSNYNANADFLNRRGACAPFPGWVNGTSCTENSDCMSRYCANGACAPQDGTGVAGEYCHHNNHCRSGTCNCPSGEANFWSLGFCPNWEDFDEKTYGTCEP